MCFDVSIGMAKPDWSIVKELNRMENEKRREHGLDAPNPSTLQDNVVPVIFEQHGSLSRCATTLPHDLQQGS